LTKAVKKEKKGSPQLLLNFQRVLNALDELICSQSALLKKLNQYSGSQSTYIKTEKERGVFELNGANLFLSVA